MSAAEYQKLFQTLADTLVDSAGDADSELRRAVLARARRLGAGEPAGEDEVPALLHPYIDKVIQHAYKVSDEDVALLKQAGYSEDAIFELTLCAAVGSGLVRLDRGLRALEAAG